MKPCKGAKLETLQQMIVESRPDHESQVNIPRAQRVVRQIFLELIKYAHCVRLAI